MREFKIGDKVKIRSDLIANRIYGTLHIFRGKMYEQLVGNVVEIVDILHQDRYIVKTIEDEKWGITDEMIEGKVDDIMVRISDLKVGDKVRIVGHRTHKMNAGGCMDKWLGKVMTVDYFYNNTCVKMKEDEGEWFWCEEMFENVVSIDIKEGMAVLLRNGQVRYVVNTSNMGVVLALGLNDTQKCCELKNYNENLENTGSLGSDFDIMTVYGFPKTIGQGGIVDFSDREIVWERQEAQEVTMQELNGILQLLGLPPVKIVE